ncbi:DNA primase [Thiorhodococcus mannitoliphagus]|uniref:DNA primase n=1 Tax=Thiorhodococcus mannitoliphagus TaxID=329406 RepID=A0A6P1DVZ0_9GAMM|nr:DNA primase [Thiorhodococcus mannitoliphagus]NEX21650.1 DNA primase [Thiorhodococcus mannitoliphagus]
MAGRIPPEFIDDLLTRTDIVELIGSRLQLRKAGKDFQARCPFHDEKTPSFTVSPDKQFYHCFGCGAHGSAIGFLMEYDHLAFPEAVEELARQAGLELPSRGETPIKTPSHAPLYELMERAAALYRRQLREHPQANRAVEYLKQRGLSGEIAGDFGLGYAPPGRDFILGQLGRTAAEQGQLLACGLIAEQEGRRYDRFRDRIIFPIRERRGRVVAFGGRLLGDGKPKYLNSPETPIFHKGRELYGLFEALKRTRKIESLVIVEGYMDVIALAQYGMTSAVATLGTATTADHLQQLHKSAPEIVFCFDGDRAGRDAAWKALQTALPLAAGHQLIRFLFLPDGEDPDTLIRRLGRDGFAELVAKGRSLSDFLFDHLAEEGDMASSDGRKRIASLARELIDKMPAGIYRDLALGRMAKLEGLPSGAVARPQRRSRGRGPQKSLPVPLSLVAKAIALLLDNPQLAGLVSQQDDRWRRSTSPGADILVQLLDMLAERPDIGKAALLERWRDHPHFNYLQQISVHPFLADIAEEDLGAEFCGAISRLNEETRKIEWRNAFNQRSVTAWSDEERARLMQQAEAARARRDELP